MAKEVSPKKRKARLEAELEQQRRKHRTHKPGSPKRRHASKAIIRIRRALNRVTAQIKQAAELARRRQNRINWNGCTPLAGRRVRKLARMVTQDPHCYITSTNGGTHAPGSWHYQNRAIDFGSSDPTNRAEGNLQARMLARFGDDFFLELFGPYDWYIKNGSRYSGQFPAHEDHGHAAA